MVFWHPVKSSDLLEPVLMCDCNPLYPVDLSSETSLLVEFDLHVDILISRVRSHGRSPILIKELVFVLGRGRTGFARDLSSVSGTMVALESQVVKALSWFELLVCCQHFVQSVSSRSVSSEMVRALGSIPERLVVRIHPDLLQFKVLDQVNFFVVE
ncbi:hypothetical protein R6Q57_021164 [Mikania cordata]